MGTKNPTAGPTKNPTAGPTTLGPVPAPTPDPTTLGPVPMPTPDPTTLGPVPAPTPDPTPAPGCGCFNEADGICDYQTTETDCYFFNPDTMWSEICCTASPTITPIPE